MTADAPLGHRQYQSLMPFRIREILLVSSDYDAFVLEEDGSLSDRIFYEYSELNLSWAPRITHTDSADAALALLSQRRFDLLVTVVKIGDVDAAAFSRDVEAQHPGMPLVLLIFDEADLRQFPHRQPPAAFDRVFQWTGSAGVLIAMIKSIEDQLNVAHDTGAGVQVILVVEDRVRAYSSFLGLLYQELLKQSGSLVAEGFNDFHRLMRMRTRPKILLANDYESAERALDEHRDSVCALMTDIRIPRRGVIAPEGGVELARAIRARRQDLPLLFQSAEPQEHAAYELGAWFVGKNARNFRARVREFLEEALGFGDFVFRLPDRTEVGRATDVYELEQALATVPAESVAYHANRHHFSIWLRARSLFDIAARVRARTVADFASIEALRRDLIAVLQRARYREQEGVITDLFSRHSGPDNRFVRIGRGSIGGKGRGSAFINAMIVQHDLLSRYDGLQIRIPKTVALGTDAFDGFMDQFDIDELLSLDDAAVTERMLAGRFDDQLQRHLRKVVMGNLKGPLAVRSSSLLEDSRFQPFAGVYATYMLPNNQADDAFRFEEVLRAIKAVYASAFWRDARNYLAGTPHDADDQKMAVVIQQVVGQRFGARFYPAASGVAQSYNYYPIGGQRPDDGVAHLALGLGHTVVSGGVALRFSPGAPTVLPQYPTAQSFFERSQRSFWAVDLKRAAVSWRDDPPEASLIRCELADAEEDGVLPLVGSVYCVADDVIRENFSLAGPRIVSFNNILKWNSLPLAEALSDLLAMLRDAMGEEVEVELAVDIPPARDDAPSSHSGSYPAPGSQPPRRGARLYLLQLRPMTSPEQRHLHQNIDALPPERLLCRTHLALGHGSYEGICDVVEVRASQLGAATSRALAARVSALNAELAREGRPYLLIGPGRWGSSDPTLGVSVSWADISGARIIVETPIGAHSVEPSQGTHFFRNITAARIGYLTVSDSERSWLDRGWLDERAGGAPSDASVRHIRLAEPTAVHIDGRRGHAVILKRQHDLSPADGVRR